MREFDFKDPRAFIYARGLTPFVLAFGAYRGRGEQVLKRHLRVDTLDASPETKYPLAAFLSALRELQSQFGPVFMRKMGNLIMGSLPIPPGFDSLEKALSMVEQGYLMNHHVEGDADIGHYRWAQTSPTRGTMTCDAPYACALDHGLLDSILAKFVEGGKVTHAEGSCRYRGDDSCTYSLEW